MNNQCEHRILADEGGCRITKCTCGTLHLSIGMTTFRLTSEGFKRLTFLMNQSLAGLRCADGARRAALRLVDESETKH